MSWPWIIAAAVFAVWGAYTLYRTGYRDGYGDGIEGDKPKRW